MDKEEKLAVYLDSQTSIGWYHQVPQSRPEEFGVISRSGGGSSEFIEDNALFTLKVWAATWERARELSQATASAITLAQCFIDTAMGASVVSVYDDPDNGNPRRRVTAQILFND